MSMSDEYRLTSIIPIADCSTHSSTTRFVFSQSRRYNDSTARQQLPLLAIWLLKTFRDTVFSTKIDKITYVPTMKVDV